MDVVLYLRYSSHSQTEQSIEGQDRVCSEYCARNNYRIIHKYIDRATTASKDVEKRTQFQQMIKDSAKHKFQAIVVYKLDRFARNRYDSATYKYRLKLHGVKVISATESIGDNPESVILESVLEGVAEYYSAELSQKIKRGMHESSLKGLYVGGTVPFGYKVENRQFVANEETSSYIPQIFNRFVLGDSYDDICEYLNANGVRTSRGNLFTKKSLYKLLQNKIYTGTYEYGGITIEDRVPALVSKDLFDEAQQIFSRRKVKRKSTRTKQDFLLTGKLFCGHCGEGMIGVSGVSKLGVAHYYYRCPASRKHECDKSPVGKTYLENIVAKEVYALLTPEIINQIAESAVKQSLEISSSDTHLQGLKSKLSDITVQINNCVAAISAGVTAKDLVNKINELDTEKSRIEEAIIKAEKDTAPLNKEQIVAWLNKFLISDINDNIFRRRLLNILVNSVTIWDVPNGQKITIALNLQGQTASVRLTEPMLHHSFYRRTDLYFITKILPRK